MKSMINNPRQSLPYHLRGAFRGFETALARYLDTVDLPLSHFYILRLQWDGHGSTQGSLARNSFMTESAASQVIQQMVKSGLLERSVDETDRRKRLVVLTEKGKKLREEVVNYGLYTSSKHSPVISKKDIRTTIDVLQQIYQAFELYNEETSKKSNK